MRVTLVKSINCVVEKTKCVHPFKDSDGIHLLFLINSFVYYVSSKQVVIISVIQGHLMIDTYITIEYIESEI